MAFTVEQRQNFIKFLHNIDATVASRLPPAAAAEFFGILVDYSVDDDQFEIKIAQLFFKMPNKLEELKESIRDISKVRAAMLERGGNAAESRIITIDYFHERIDEYLELHDIILIQNENEYESGLRQDRKQRRQKKLEMEKSLRILQVERQLIFEKERNERVERRELKKEVEATIRDQRQREFDQEVVERKDRREKIEQEIAVLTEQLQTQHNKEVEDRKLRKQQKEQELEMKQRLQEEEQLRQAENRKRVKDEQEMSFQARQQQLLEEQEKQGVIRKERKKREDDIKNQIYQQQEQQSQERMKKKREKEGKMGQKETDI